MNMPQTFQVLRCYECKVFQVHPTKKSTKWQCKLCGEKQSIKRFYGLGTGKECRLHVQKLNGIRAEIDGNCSTTSDFSDTEVTESLDQPDQITIPVCSTSHKSKWHDYVDTQEIQSQKTTDETMHLNDTEVVLELPVKHRKKSFNVKTKTFRTPNIIKNENLRSQNSKEKNESVEETRPMESHDYAKENVSSYLENNKVDVNSYVCKPVPIPKKYVPSPVANNSKWAEFVDEPQSDNDESDPIAHSAVVPVFPFLDDENIDSFLDL